MNMLFKLGFAKESRGLGAWGENSQEVTFVTYVFWSLNYSVYVLFQRGQMSKLVQVQVKFHESKERKKVIYDFAWNEGPKNLPPKFFLESILENLCEVSKAGARLYVVQILDCHSHEISYHGHWIWDMRYVFRPQYFFFTSNPQIELHDAGYKKIETCIFKTARKFWPRANRRKKEKRCYLK